jgi:hypothetical protein
MSRTSFKTELIWFFGVLVLFIAFLLIAGPPNPIELVIAITAFSFIWLLKSILVKKFALPKDDIKNTGS